MSTFSSFYMTSPKSLSASEIITYENKTENMMHDMEETKS